MLKWIGVHISTLRVCFQTVVCLKKLINKKLFKKLFRVLDNLRCSLSVSINVPNNSAGSCNEIKNIFYNTVGQGLSCSLLTQSRAEF